MGQTVAAPKQSDCEAAYDGMDSRRPSTLGTDRRGRL